MKHFLAFTTVTLVSMTSLAEAKPGGCMKYGAGGAVAGHMAHHGVKGFMAGCAVGMYRRHEYNKQMRAGEQQQ